MAHTCALQCMHHRPLTLFYSLLAARTAAPFSVAASNRPATRRASTMASTSFISATDRYLFDLNGYIVVKNVFTPAEIALANGLVDTNMPSSKERLDPAIRNTKATSALAGDGDKGRIDLGGLLAWEGEGSGMFKDVLDHPKLVPYFHELIGPGYRMDHMPFLIAQNKGSEGFSLHGGTIDVGSGKYNHEIAYSCVHDVLRSNLLAASVVMSDHPAGSGGYVVVRGSHKSNFQAPASMIDGDEHMEFVYQPETEAGDVVLFSEGTVHGARPWNMDYQRRVALYRFSPPTCGYGRSYFEDGNASWPKEIYSGMSETQKSVMLPPYAIRLDRPVNDGTGRLKVDSRSDAKKQFDKAVFGTKYF